MRYEIYEQIAEKVAFPEEFGYDSDNDDESPLEWVKDDVYSISHNIDIAHGVSKFVMIQPEYDKVLKVPFSGELFYSEDYNEETKEWEYAETSSFDQFTGANGDYSDWNYCEKEVEVYQMAEEAGVAQFFAKIETFEPKTIKGRMPLYLQEKVKSINDYGISSLKPSEKSLSLIQEDNKKEWSKKKYAGINNNNWLALAIDVYGEEELDKLMAFIKDYEKQWTDFHNGNIGYREDGTPVLLDYSGFHS